MLAAATAVLVVGATQAFGATSHPTSDGSDGACDFNGAVNTVTDFRFAMHAAAGGDPARRVIECTTITVSGATVVTGDLPVELRATGDVQINAPLDLSANNQTPGPGGAAAGPSGGDGQGPGRAFAGSPAAAGGFGGAGGASYGGTGGMSGSNGAPNYGGGGGGAGSGGGFSAGSGGGGGGSSSGGTSTGGAGGAGGGAVRIVSETEISIGTGGSIATKGGLPAGPSGSSAPYGGQGGAGSGGSILLIAPSVAIAAGAPRLNATGGDADLPVLPINGTVARGGDGANGRITITTNSAVDPASTNPASPTVVDHSDVLTVGRSGSGSGMVTSSPGGIDCGTDCDELYDPGTDVTLTAAPASGSEFGGWTGDCAGQGTTCTLTAAGDHAATAIFNSASSSDPTTTTGDGGTTTTTTGDAGTATTTTTTTTTPPAVVGPPLVTVADRLAPTVSGFSLSPRRIGRRGATIRFTLSEAATVRIVFQRRVRRRFRSAGTLARSAPVGANRIRFTGRVAGRRLRRGRYRATLVATDAAGNRSAPVRATFVRR